MDNSSSPHAPPLSDNRIMDALLQNSDLLFAAILLASILLLLVPVPALALDIGVAMNLAFSFLLVIVGTYVTGPLQLSSLPSLLLITTLFRLGLNLASTKLILLHGEAGRIIEAFGQMIVGGNLLVGITTFAIITVVQLMVVTKGAERVAEVGARFTLDGMPGKQMAIDADLRNGHIAAAEAKTKRRHIELESQFYGAMDGAMKFIKGDAIAGLIIMLLNLVVGILVGVLYRGMEFGASANTYSVLSIGDALVSQIPSLLIAVTAGFVATRVGSPTGRGETLGAAIVNQLLGQPRALLVAASLIVALALIPGFPLLYFLIMGLALMVVRYLVSPFRKQSMVQVNRVPVPALAREGSEEVPNFVSESESTITEPLGLRMERGLTEKLRPGRFNFHLNALRTQLNAELGFPFPGAQITHGGGLDRNQIVVAVYEVPFFSLVWRPGQVLRAAKAESPADAQDCIDVPGLGPMSWAPALEVASDGAGHDLTCEEVLAHLVVAAVRANIGRFVGMNETKYILEAADVHLGGLARQLTEIVPVQRVSEVFKRLLEEGISIRNMRVICESLISWGSREKDSGMLSEYIRCDLGEYVTYRAARGGSELHGIVLDPSSEQAVRESIQHSANGSYLTLSPDRIQSLQASLQQAMLGGRGDVPTAVICGMDIRRYIRKILAQTHPDVFVLSYQELKDNVRVVPAGRVSIDLEAP